jgi:hypothetical protein
LKSLLTFLPGSSLWSSFPMSICCKTDVLRNPGCESRGMEVL